MNKRFSEKVGEGTSAECFAALQDFFNQHNLEESRNVLWKWLNVSGSQSFHKLPPKEQDELLTFYSYLQGLLETVHTAKCVFDRDNNCVQRKPR